MKFIRLYFALFSLAAIFMLLQVGCEIKAGGQGLSGNFKANEEGNTIETRYPVEQGFSRLQVKENSFGDFLRSLKLKPMGTKVRYYNGEIKSKGNVYHSVLDLEIGNKDLQQCADAVMRLRAEYLFQQQRYDEIHFNFTNGFRADYSMWMQGNRIKVSGNKVTWVKQANASNTYDSFRKYLEVVFMYAGTLSLSKELHSKSLGNMQCGDVFIQGGSPGHAVLVVDMMENATTRERYFMLVQSYMPAQDIQVLLNPITPHETVWYLLDSTAQLIKTPEWSFTGKDLKCFSN
jgi:Domain of unknown function (4846)